MTQNQSILSLLKRKKGGITAIDALNYTGCFRLAARIHELKSQGIKINSVRDRKSNGKETKYFNRYYLK